MSTIGKIKVGGTTYDIAYPVGSIYLSVNDTSPAELFGGTWEQLKDRFLLAAGDTYAAGSTGGEAQHNLTVAEMPSHQHEEKIGDQSESQGINVLKRRLKNGTNSGAVIEASWKTTGIGESIMTNYCGGSEPHNNMPPYLAVYMWKRIA